MNMNTFINDYEEEFEKLDKEDHGSRFWMRGFISDLKIYQKEMKEWADKNLPIHPHRKNLIKAFGLEIKEY